MDSTQQAMKIYEVCVVNAKRGKTLTYREVLDYMAMESVFKVILLGMD